MDEVIIEMQGRIEDLDDKVSSINECTTELLERIMELEDWIRSAPVNESESKEEDDIKLLKKKEEPKKPRTVQEIKELKSKWIEEQKQAQKLADARAIVDARLQFDDRVEFMVKDERKDVDIFVLTRLQDRFIELMKKDGFEVKKSDGNFVNVIIP